MENLDNAKLNKAANDLWSMAVKKPFKPMFSDIDDHDCHLSPEDSCACSDYPLGGMIEPYDMAVESELTAE